MVGQITGPDGSPMPAHLNFLPIPPGSGIRGASATADSSGVYSVRLAASTYDVVIQPSVPGFLYHVQRSEFSRSSTRFDHRFSGYVLTGTVRDPDGAVVDSGTVWVEILTPTRYNIGRAVLTQGSFSFLLSTGTYLLNAESNEIWSGISRMTSASFSVHSDTTVDFDMSGIQVTGQVLGPSGTPLRAAVFALGDLNRARYLTESDGRYRLWLHPGPYRLGASPYDSVHIVGRLTGSVQIQSPITANFDLAGVDWIGTVTWRATGDPVPDVVVTAFDAEEDRLWAGYQTGSDGMFRLVVEHGHRYDLYASYGGVQSIWIDSLTAREDTSFVLIADPDPTPSRPTPAPPAGRGIPSPGPSGP